MVSLHACWHAIINIRKYLFCIDTDDMQFGSMKGKGTTDTIYIVRQMQDKFRPKGKKLYFGFVDLEKLFIEFQKKW